MRVVEYGVGDSVVLKDGTVGTITKLKDGLFCIVVKTFSKQKRSLRLAT